MYHLVALFLYLYSLTDVIGLQFDNPEFLQSYNERLKLDRSKTKFPLEREAFLLKEFKRYKSQSNKRNVKLLRAFCKRKKVGGCSWNEVNMLLKQYPLSTSKDRSNDFSNWLMDSERVKSSIPDKLRSECIRLKSFPSRADFLLDYIATSRPFVVENGASKWPAMQKWNLDYISESLTDDNRVVKMYTSLDGDFEKIQTLEDWKELLSRAGGEMMNSPEDSMLPPTEQLMIRPAENLVDFDQFVRLARHYPNEENVTFYLQKHDLRRWKDLRLWKDLQPSVVPDNDEDRDDKTKTSTKKKNKTKNNTKNKKKSAKANAKTKSKTNSDDGDSFGMSNFLSLEHYLLWISKGVVTRGPVHYDQNENLLAMIRGSKRFHLFHPMDTEAMYEANATFHSAHLLLSVSEAPDTMEASLRYWSLPVSMTPKAYQPFSPVNVTHPDLRMHPKFSKAHHVICDVNEGDVIYVPAYWWHEVSSQTAAHRSDGEEPITIGVNAFFLPWWQKGGDLKHFVFSSHYTHLHELVPPIMMSRKNTKSVRSNAEKALAGNAWTR